eukprot:EG_transcript_15255
MGPKRKGEPDRLAATLRAFDAHYGAVYGGRWVGLRQAMQQPTQHIVRVNGFAPMEEAQLFRQEFDCRPVTAAASHPIFENCLIAQKLPPGTPPRCRDGSLCLYYLMDFGSVVAAWAVGAKPGDRVLDLCAAPGGKSLILAEAVGEGGRVVCNEMSAPRRARLLKVLKDYVPYARKHVAAVTGHDATQWRRSARGAPVKDFQAVLLDAPCSSERHLLHDPKELLTWTPKRTKQNAKRQLDILLQAIHAVAPGGRLLYSTCSISPLENDAVVEKLVKKRGDLVQVATEADFPNSPAALGAEPTRVGWTFLPDRCGWGPLYFSLLLARPRAAAEAGGEDGDGDGEEDEEEEDDEDSGDEPMGERRRAEAEDPEEEEEEDEETS